MRLAEPAGAFYALPDVTDYFGPGAHAQGFGPVPDVDALCRCSLTTLKASMAACTEATVAVASYRLD